jgi:hypothetical protein
MYVPDHIESFRLYAGNIDIRFHFHRLNVDLKEFVDKLEQELLSLNISDIELVAPLYIENESRKLPGTGLYKKQPFYGSWQEREDIRVEYTKLLEDISFKNGWKIIYCPKEYINEKGELDFKYMEPKGSVHLSPNYYLYGV